LINVKNMDAPESNTKNCIFPSGRTIGVVDTVIGSLIVLNGSRQQGQTVILSFF
jgi:hypothetical protein